MLYIVATPIGNLKEMTYRAVEVLQSADFILAEDTRHSAVLMQAYNIHTRCVSYQKFNEQARCGEVIDALKAGKDVALISDAGMPLISDPGSVLIAKIIEEGLSYSVVSGPCAAVSAAVLSGLDLSSFCMAGFLPDKNIDRVRTVERFSSLTCTLIFYISPHAIDDDLTFLYEKLGNRKVALVREISKKFEEVIRFSLGEVPKFTHKGEFVLVAEGARPAHESLIALTLHEHVAHYLALGLNKKEAMKRAAQDRGVPKSEIYNALLKKEG